MIIINYAFKCDNICGYMTVFFPGSYFSQILLPFMFLITEPGVHFTDAEAAACPYKFYACFLINLDIAFWL